MSAREVRIPEARRTAGLAPAEARRLVETMIAKGLIRRPAPEPPKRAYARPAVTQRAKRYDASRIKTLRMEHLLRLLRAGPQHPETLVLAINITFRDLEDLIAFARLRDLNVVYDNAIRSYLLIPEAGAAKL